MGYINLHGTATPLNDQIESHVVSELFGERVPCSSTKHLTGHTLGAAGITEAAISMLILQRNLPLPPQDFSTSPRDETLPACGSSRARSRWRARLSCPTHLPLAAITPASCSGECHELLFNTR
ncbi:3-oxoacyl-[acyl-carrier-protein] synthase 2 [Kluyvera intermedia]|nr:3-oxoacyl-[acyl-carrier-protein] synthase 2 [Kluyvera intermedia]